MTNTVVAVVVMIIVVGDSPPSPVILKASSGGGLPPRPRPRPLFVIKITPAYRTDNGTGIGCVMRLVVWSWYRPATSQPMPPPPLPLARILGNVRGQVIIEER